MAALPDLADDVAAAVPMGGSRQVVPPYVLVQARRGWMLVNVNDRYMGQAYLRYGECCEQETEFLLSLLRVPGLVVEAGANMGVHTVPMARALGERRLLVLEPQRVIFQQLCANLALNGLRNVTALPYAAGSETGAAAMELPDYGRPGNFGAASLEVPDGSRSETVQCVRLDDLVSGEHVGLMKVDVEGAELKVLKGAEKIILRDRPVLYLENDRIDRSRALIEWLRERKYRLWWHRPKLYNPGNLRGAVPANEDAQLCSVNMLCLPRESAMAVEGEQEIADDGWHLAMHGA